MTDLTIPGELPVLPLQNHVMFPRVGFPINVGKERSIRLIDEVAVSDDKMLITVAQTKPDVEDPMPKDLYRVGTVVQITRLIKTPEGHHHVIVQGLSRVRLVRFVQTDPFIRARARVIVDEVPRRQKKKSEIAFLGLMDIALKLVNADPKTPDEAALALANVDQPGDLANLITFNLELPTKERQLVLETANVVRRVEMVTTLASRELAKLELSQKIQTKARATIEKTQREYFLRQQLKEIQGELGEGDESRTEIEELRKQIVAAQLPPAAHEQAMRELDRLMRIPSVSPEHAVSRNYVEWLATLPWTLHLGPRINLRKARAVLDEDHYDLEKVKKRIVEFLAVLKLKETHRGPILCFVGPPGVGKTSLGRSIARAAGRKFIRASLGGVRDEAEIRGHRRTYVGALPGRIIRGLRDAGTKNPVFMLDEIDKLGMDHHGDPASALLEVLDPQQNDTFVDHYLDVPFDLSDVMFIATANYLDPVPPALRDRMEIIQLFGYTEEEKIEIANRHILPRLLADHGLKKSNLRIGKRGLREVIRSYTREAGLRRLEQKLASICRSAAFRVANRRSTSLSVNTAAQVATHLGPPVFLLEEVERRSVPGVTIGLAWSPTGGDILFIEATMMSGKGGLILTGHLGEVMKESAQTSLSYVRSRSSQFGLDDRLFAETDLHIHVPAGAIPKDGPSAGVAIFLAITSLLSEKPVRPYLAVTGEVTLRGHVLPVGGIKDKLLAAYRAGVKTVLIPKGNQIDLEELPAEVKKNLEIRLIANLDEAHNEAFPAPKSRSQKKKTKKTTNRKRK